MHELTYSQVAELLRHHGTRPTEQRVVIYTYLLNKRIHPTAEIIFQDLKDIHPTLSLTTVYNTLKALSDCHLVTPLTIEDGEVRYDVNTTWHAHFKCLECNRIYDFNGISVADLILKNPEYSISEIHLDLYGHCPDCKKANDLAKEAVEKN